MNAPTQSDPHPCEVPRRLVQAGELTHPEVHLHVAACPDCAALAARMGRLQSALGQLGRQRAPVQLDGLVAESLDRGPAERLLGQLGRVRAPQVLERLVAEELAAPELYTIRRTMDGLPRLAAPANVAEFGAVSRGSKVLAAPATLARRALVGLLAAGALGLMWIRWDGAQEGTHVLAQGAGVERPPLRWKAVTLVSPDRLDPVAQAFVSGLGGGAPLMPPSVPR